MKYDGIHFIEGTDLKLVHTSVDGSGSDTHKPSFAHWWSLIVQPHWSVAVDLKI